VRNLFTLSVISDIHSNFEALTAVLNDLDTNFPEIKEVYCLGDLVGYGPDPKSCLEFVFNKEKFITKIVMGNHDDFVGRHSLPPQVNPIAKIANDYQIENTPLELRWKLTQLPHTISTKHGGIDKEIVFVHGSPQYPLTEYIYPHTFKQENLFNYMNSADIDILILGHTHIPFIRKTENTRDLMIINPGSVGQPRDGDPRASYAVIDVKNFEAEIKRIDYNISSVYEKIKMSGLPISLGSRLYNGK